MSRRLVIISVPLSRIARVTLSEEFLGPLRKEFDIAIVAPFASDPAFVKTFGGARTSLLRWTMPTLTRARRTLLAISEVLRRDGYWWRFRHDGMEHYLRNQFTIPGENGRDRRMPLARAAAFRALAIMGSWPRAWKLVDRILGTGWAAFPDLERLASGYSSVTIVQSASWGEQDRALATLSRRHRWRRVLVPYTVDQLDVNGYLLNDFDVVCPQGPFEEERARSKHDIGDDRLCRLGSAWFRHLERVREGLGATLRDAEPFVMYAGVSPLYFPRAVEARAVDRLSAFLEAEFPSLRLIYRPVEADATRRREIESRYRDCPNVGIQWPTTSEVGLGEYGDTDQRESMRQYVRNLAGCRLLVMSSITSLAIDIAKLERCGVVANQFDDTGMLAKRFADRLDRAWFGSFRMVRSLDDMIVQSRVLLTNGAEAKTEAEELTGWWDYANQDFASNLLKAVSGRLGTAA